MTWNASSYYVFLYLACFVVSTVCPKKMAQNDLTAIS